jgi:hypothetical protein
MKAILIDATQRVVRGIEIDNSTLKLAFSTIKTVVPVALASIVIDRSTVLFYDRNAVLKHPADFFYLEGLSGPIFGKGLLLGHREGFGPGSIPFTATYVEALVGFHKTG